MICRRAWIVGVVVAACSDDPSAPAAPEPPPVTPDEVAAAPADPAPEGPPLVARVARAAVPGEAAQGILPPALRVGARHPRGSVIASGPAEVVLDLGRAGRITLAPGTRVRLDGPEPAAVLLAIGQLHAERPPQGNGPRPALRVATPAGTLVLEGSGEALVLALPDGRGWVAQLAGLGRVRTGAEAPGEEGGGRPATVDVTPGHALAVGAETALEGPADLAAAQQAAGVLREDALVTPASALVARTRAADRAVDALLEAAQRLDEEGGRLERMQRGFVDSARRAEAESLQPVLVRHSQSLGRLRERLRVRAERAAVLHLRTERADAPERALRVAAALGREDGGLPPFVAAGANAGPAPLRTSPAPPAERPVPSPDRDESAAPEGR